MKRWVLTGGLIIVGVVFIIVGISLGEPQSVLNKAIRICLECVGIG